MDHPYAYIWEYIIDPAHEEKFLDAYGPEGVWVTLFKEYDGYIRTELVRDRENPNRYVTIDYWESREAWEKFRREADERFRLLDDACDEFTISEREIGTFDITRSHRPGGG